MLTPFVTGRDSTTLSVVNVLGYALTSTMAWRELGTSRVPMTC
jgi:hypothetical protein